MKQRCAREAVKYIKNGMVVGLGGGSTIAYLVDCIKEQALDIKIVTPSNATQQLCVEKGLHVLSTKYVSHVDVAFDGCDEVDLNLFALKSGGGIHTREKIIGTMADEYILLVDSSKVYTSLGFEHPLVLEVVCDAYSHVKERVEALKGRVSIRSAGNKDGGILSDQGLMLVDVLFTKEDVKDIQTLHDQLMSIVGILDISLFANVVSKVLVVKEDGFEEITK